MTINQTIGTAARVAERGTILGVCAHPDDEAYLSGGLMAIAREHGSRVVCVTATRGELGTPDPLAWPPERLAAGRTAEMKRSLDALGVQEHHWLDYRDGECAAADAISASTRIAEFIDLVRPDTVLTFGSDGITGHPDHQSVGAWTTAAFDRAAPRGTRLLYATFEERRGPRWGALNESLGIFPPGYPVFTRRSASRSTCDSTRPPSHARSRHWWRSRRRRACSPTRWGSTSIPSG